MKQSGARLGDCLGMLRPFFLRISDSLYHKRRNGFKERDWKDKVANRFGVCDNTQRRNILEETSKSGGRNAGLFRLARFLKPYRKQAIVGPVFKLIEAILELIVPLVMARVIDIGVIGKNPDYIWRNGLLMLGLCIAGLLSALVCQYSASVASQGFGTLLRNALFKKIGTLSYRQLDKFGTPSLINRVTNDVNQLQFAVAMLIRLVIRAPFLCIGSLIIAMTIDFQLALIMLGVILVFTVVLYWVMAKSVPLYRIVQKELDGIALMLREALSGMRVIRAFGQEQEQKRRFGQANEQHADTVVRVGKIAALMNPLTLFIMNMGIIAVLWFGGIRVDSGEMSVGSVVAFISYIASILMAMIVVANLVVTFTKAAAASTRVGEVLDMPVDLEDGSGAEPTEAAPVVAFRSVSFAYESGGEEVLTDIDFSLGRGEMLGIIGGTGSGKSTLVQLIPRFYEVSAGAVLFCGADVCDYKKHELLQHIALVPQEAVLFSGTIADNLRYGKQDATQEEMRISARAAQIDRMIDDLPRGYDAPVTPNGLNFSGGQRQRLCIARALVRKPSLLILDDSFSALDALTASALRKALREDYKGMTTISISQQVAAVMHCDRILVLDDGVMVDIGSHEQLFASCDLYRELCALQLEEAGA